MKKVLLISTQSCYPLFSGGALAQYYFIDGLKDEVEFVMCPTVRSNKEMTDVELLQEKQPNLKIYPYDVRSFPKKPSFLLKLKALVRQILPKKVDAGYAPVEDDFHDSYFAHVDHDFSAAWIKLINEVIEKEHIEIVQYDFYDTIDVVYALPMHVKKIFVEHEVRFKRLKLAAAKSLMPEAYKESLIAKTEAFERQCASIADVVVVFNEDDAELLRPSCKQVVVSPFAIPDENIFENVQANNFDKLLFVGGDGHNPNVMGLTWFLENIYLPNIESIKLPLYVVGSWGELYRQKYAQYPQVIFTGKVPSIAPWFDHSVFVNPILSGAGLRTKVLHAMVNGVPVMSTRFGAEGCYSDTERNHIVLFDNAVEFIFGLSNANMEKIGEAGKIYYENIFSKDKLLSIRKKLYDN